MTATKGAPSEKWWVHPEEKCDRCGELIWAFDGSVHHGTGEKYHSDCKKAAAKDRRSIVANLQSAAYDATRYWWGFGIYETDKIPEEYRNIVDKVVFEMVNRLEDTLKECWTR